MVIARPLPDRALFNALRRRRAFAGERSKYAVSVKLLFGSVPIRGNVG